MRVGLEKIDTYEGVTVKALLDSGATGMFVDRKFVEKHGCHKPPLWLSPFLLFFSLYFLFYL